LLWERFASGSTELIEAFMPDAVQARLHALLAATAERLTK
jgi:hypothetical protein